MMMAIPSESEMSRYHASLAESSTAPSEGSPRKKPSSANFAFSMSEEASLHMWEASVAKSRSALRAVRQSSSASALPATDETLPATDAN